MAECSVGGDTATSLVASRPVSLRKRRSNGSWKGGQRRWGGNLGAGRGVPVRTYEDAMPDLMTASGRASMLKSLTPNIAKLEKTLARQSQPILKMLGSLDTATVAKLGGGVAAFAAIFYAAQSLLKKPAAKTAKAQVKRVRRAAKSGATRTGGAVARARSPARAA